MSHCIFFEFAYKNDEYRSDYFTAFYNTLEYCEVGLFFIKDIKIKRSGKTVFTNNKDYDKYYQTGRENLKNYSKEKLANNQTPARFNGVGSEINSYIGQPINIYGNKGILAFVDNSENKSLITVFYSYFGHLLGIDIPKKSIVNIQKNGVLKITENKNKYPSFEDFLYGSKK